MRVCVSGSARQSVVLSSAMFGSQSTLPWSSETLLKCDFSETVTALPWAAISVQMRLNASSSASIMALRDL